MTPDSSRTSRRTASSTDSPASTNPIGTEVKQFIPANTLIQNIGGFLTSQTRILSLWPSCLSTQQYFVLSRMYDANNDDRIYFSDLSVAVSIFAGPLAHITCSGIGKVMDTFRADARYGFLGWTSLRRANTFVASFGRHSTSATCWTKLVTKIPVDCERW
jgi:hypothetical protein